MRMASKHAPAVVYFIDRSLGKIAGRILQAAGAIVELHDDHFPQDTPDEKLLPQVAEKGWLFITKDKRIRHRTLEREAVLASGLRVFVLSATKKMTGAQMGDLLIKHRAKIERLARKQEPPFIAGVYDWGVELLKLSNEDDE
jgi:hypothetical protein